MTCNEQAKSLVSINTLKSGFHSTLEMMPDLALMTIRTRVPPLN